MARGQNSVVWLALTTVAAVVLWIFVVYDVRHRPQPNHLPRIQSASPTRPLPALPLPGRGSPVMIIGDSWTAGYDARPPTRGYAYVLGEQMGWATTVDGVSGTGYVNPGPYDEGTYAERIDELDPAISPQLVILQGGLNDGSTDWHAFGWEVSNTIDELRAKYPDAQLVLVGPASPTPPADQRILAVDRELRLAAGRAGLHYVSPVADGWITAETVADFIDPVTMHPTTEGHAFYARQLATALQQLATEPAGAEPERVD